MHQHAVSQIIRPNKKLKKPPQRKQQFVRIVKEEKQQQNNQPTKHIKKTHTIYCKQVGDNFLFLFSKGDNFLFLFSNLNGVLSDIFIF